MMEGEVNLGLSLGIGGVSGFHRSPRLPPPQLRPVACPLLAAHERAPAAGTHWCHLFASSASDGRRSLVKCPFPKGVDANGTPATDGRETDAEEEDGVSSPNSTLSCAVSGGGAGNNKRSESGHRPDGSVQGDDNGLERAFSRVMSDEEDGGDGSQNKKLRLSKEQAAILEASFKDQHTLNPRQKLALAKQLNVRPRQVEVWFQNRRARTKLKQTEVDCELLRRCCQGLTEENRRLQKEVHELRALKLLSPQPYMHMAPATTLTLCPSCERPPSLSSAPNPNPSPTVALASPLVPPLALAGGQHLQQSPQQRLRPHAVLPPPHLVPAHRRPIAVASAGRNSLPWAPTPHRAAAFIDAPAHR